MKKVIRVIYHNFYTPDGKSESVGGIQTYLRNLLPYLVELGYEVLFFQKGDLEFHKDFRGVHVVGCILDAPKYKDQVKQLLANASKGADLSNDILFFATTTDIVKNNYKKAIAIQHGITWDVEKHKNYSHKRNCLQVFLKAILAFRTIKEMDYVSHIVCVDYNFLNWYRTQVAYTDHIFDVIPNFVQIAETQEKSNEQVKIIFARRFQTYRGTRLFAPVVRRLIDEGLNIHCTFAGDGPDAAYLHEMFDGNKQVSFIKYKSDESLDIHKSMDIAVIPTIGSEGTSLSLLEAMSAQCAVICTNVGGMTNVVIDGYNGIMISPESDELYYALVRLIKDRRLRQKLAWYAYETVREGFSLEIWKKKWKDVFTKI